MFFYRKKLYSDVKITQQFNNMLAKVICLFIFNINPQVSCLCIMIFSQIRFKNKSRANLIYEELDHS